MMKFQHEVRDPLHAFVRMDSYERQVVDSAALQRLRYIHQLALTSMVYPAATHRRFEHSLGVMELAGRAFDVVTHPHNLENARDLVPELTDERTISQWRPVVRMAALCHDIGHVPFSHAGEDLLPAGHDHESVTRDLILNGEIADVMQSGPVQVDPEQVASLAVKGAVLPPWQQVLADLIQSDFFGADRIDYLLRDSLHVGVAYGRFDHFRLIDTLRILPAPPTDENGDAAHSDEPELGVEEGGLQSSEGLLLARYFMHSQVYMHQVRRIYDVHLRDFLQAWMPDGLPVDPQEHLALTDDEVLVAMRRVVQEGDAEAPGFDAARRVIERRHFKKLFRPVAADYDVNLEAGKAIFRAAVAEFGPESVRYSPYQSTPSDEDFPVLIDGSVESATANSQVIGQVPMVRSDYVYIDPDRLDEGKRWLRDNKRRELETRLPSEEDGET